MGVVNVGISEMELIPISRHENLIPFRNIKYFGVNLFYDKAKALFQKTEGRGFDSRRSD
jgi:hypothetical protein